MRRPLLATTAAAASAAVVLAGCGGSTEAPAAPATVTVTQAAPTPSATSETEPAPTPTDEETEVDVEEAEAEVAVPTGEAERSDRGALVKDIGEPAGVGTSLDDLYATVTVTDIEVDYECTAEYAEGEPENGHFIALTVEAEVAPDARERDMEADPEQLAPFEGWYFGSAFGLIDDEGVTQNNPNSYAAVACVDEAEALPAEVGPGETVRGVVVLDSTSTSGYATYDNLDPYSYSGWEWGF